MEDSEKLGAYGQVGWGKFMFRSEAAGISQRLEAWMRKAFVKVSTALVYVALLGCIGEYAFVEARRDQLGPRSPVDSHSPTPNQIPR